MTKRPSGLRQSEAILARNLLGATPAEAVRLSSSRICWRMARGDACGGGEAGFVFGDVEVGFVERERFDEVGVTLEDLAGLAGDGAVTGEVGRDEDGGGAEALGANGGHGGADAEGSRFIGCGADDGAIAAPRDDDGFAAEVADRRVARRRRRRRPCRCERSCGQSSGNMVCGVGSVCLAVGGNCRLYRASSFMLMTKASEAARKPPFSVQISWKNCLSRSRRVWSGTLSRTS